MSYDNDLINALYVELYSMHNAMSWVSLHDIDESMFKTKHKNVLNVDLNIDPIIIGDYLIMHYYNNVWNSRSESSILSEYLNLVDEYTFYCSSNRFEDIDAECLLMLNNANREDITRMNRLIMNGDDIKFVDSEGV